MKKLIFAWYFLTTLSVCAESKSAKLCNANKPQSITQSLFALLDSSYVVDFHHLAYHILA